MSLPLLPALAAHPVLAPVGVVLLVLVALALLYPNTIVGSKIRSDVPVAEGGLPILGHQPRLGKFRNKRLERLLELMEKQGEVVRTTFWTPATGIVDILLISNLQVRLQAHGAEGVARILGWKSNDRMIGD